MKVNLSNIRDNIDYLNKLEVTDIEDIFEKIEILFLVPPSKFKNKIDNLINELGYDYVDIIENDLPILEQLL